MSANASDAGHGAGSTGADTPLLVAHLLESFDWSATPLGPRSGWPTSLKTAISLMLCSPVPIVSLWGAQGIMIYNDAYSAFAGQRHPRLFGSPVREGWPEVADFNDNVMRVCLAGGTLSYRDHELRLQRFGRLERVWMNLDYSPVIGENGEPTGVIAIVVETTQAVQAAHRLRESEARFRALTHASSNVIYRMSADWREMRQLDGQRFLSDTESPSVAWLDEYILAEDQEAILARIERAVRTKSVYEHEHRIRTADGTIGWTFSRAIPVLDEQGEIVEWFGSATEVTGRRETEERLRFLDALGTETAKSADADTILAVTTRMTGEHLGVSICAYADMDPDQNGFTIRDDWAAPGARHIVGHYRLADFGSLTVEKLSAGKPLVINNNQVELPPAEAAIFQQMGIGATVCMPLVKEGRLTALMAVHHRAPHKWSENELALVGEVTQRSWAHIERVRSAAEVRATERRFREELEGQVAERTAAVQQSEKTIRTIFETSYMSQGLLTTGGRIVYVNATLLASIDSRLDDVLARYFWDTPWFTGTPGMPEKIREAVARAAAGENVEMSMPLDMPTGHRIYEFSIRPAIDAGGKVMALVPEAVEITARVRAEEALQQARKVEALGSLTGGIAHDFNNLLLPIMGSLDLLRRRLPDNPALLKFVDQAMEGARRGAALTSRMLAFARKQELKPQRTDIGSLVHGMTELMTRTLGAVELDVQIGADLPDAMTDPNQLEAALLNLVVNARDAMDGQGRIVIEAAEARIGSDRHRLRPGRYVGLSVTDTGHGMDENTLKRATEPFFTTKGVGKGTGLGLPMVHGIAEQSGGALVLESAVGKGTRAQILLPALPRATTSPGEQPPEATASWSLHSSKGMRILAVDDDPLILSSTVDMLEDLGFVVVSATSGKEALDRLKSETFDLLITDHAMPRMTGAELMRQVRASHPDLPIILSTGYAELPASTGVDFVRLAKPFTRTELGEALLKQRMNQANEASC